MLNFIYLVHIKKNLVLRIRLLYRPGISCAYKEGGGEGEEKDAAGKRMNEENEEAMGEKRKGRRWWGRGGDANQERRAVTRI